MSKKNAIETQKKRLGEVLRKNLKRRKDFAKKTRLALDIRMCKFILSS